LGLPVFRFYDKDNAAAVTLTGQDIIKTAEKSINLYYKNILGKSYKVTYEDGTTDILYKSDLDKLNVKI
jgi:DNA polymerase elongation subunit (family B)